MHTTNPIQAKLTRPLQQFVILVTALVPMILAGCGGDHMTDPAAVTFAGTYQLRSMNGQALPFVILQQGQHSITILSDQIIMADGGTWGESFSFRVTDTGTTTTQTSTDAGTWVRSGSTLELDSYAQGHIPYRGTFTNTSLNLNDGTFAYVFTR